MRNIIENCCTSHLAMAIVFVLANACAGDEPTPQQLESRSKVLDALRWEVAGDQQARDAELASALALDPLCAPAHWHSGHVQQNEQWITIERAQELNVADTHTAKFSQLRARLAGSVAGELELARWCRLRRPDVARFYYARLLGSGKLQPRFRQEAIEALELRLFNQRLIPKRDYEQYKSAKKLADRAQQRWRPKLFKWQRAFAGISDRTRVFARDEIRKVDDPYFVVVAQQFADTNQTSFAISLVNKIAEFPEYEATQALTKFALMCPSSGASRQLANRPPHDFVPTLLNFLISPIDFEWEVVRLPDGTSIYSDSLYQEGPVRNRKLVSVRSFEVPDPIVEPGEGWATTWSQDSTSRRIADDAEEALEDKGEAREEMVEDFNERVAERNELVTEALRTSTGINESRTPGEWWDWWNQYNEVHHQRETETLFNVRRSFSRHRPYYRAISCFTAGTPVVTDSGFVPIETIRTGDRVLSQDVNTGEVRFRVVVETTTRSPSPITQLTIEGEQINATLGHPIWTTNKDGWKMAKLLKIGDQLHGVRGIKMVKQVQMLPNPQTAYNLIVEGTSTYFVGRNMVLVHDNTYRDPTTSMIPGLPRTVVPRPRF